MKLEFLRDHEKKLSFTRTMGYYLFWFLVLFTAIYLIKNEDISTNFIIYTSLFLSAILAPKAFSHVYEVKKKQKDK